MSVLTVYCAGTKYDRFSPDIIAELYPLTTSQSIFVDGPGSMNRIKTTLFRAPAPVTGIRTVDSLLNATATAIDNNVTTPMMYVADNAFALTVMNNVNEAVRLIRGVTPKPAVVNFAGWSRGSITAIIIANQLTDVAVNLFLFDPVPGGPNDGLRELASKIGPHVRNCTAVLMRDETGLVSQLFKPLEEPFLESRSGFTVHVLPGVHGSAVELKGDGKEIYYDCAHIGAHMVTEFLQDNGTAVAGTRLLTPIDRIACYGRVALREVYGQLSDGVRPGLTINDSHNALFFVNADHQALFRSQFPSMYMKLNAWLMGDADWSPSIAAEARLLRTAAPAMAQVIVQTITLGKGNDPRQALLEALGFQGRVQPTDACFIVRTGY